MSYVVCECMPRVPVDLCRKALTYSACVCVCVCARARVHAPLHLCTCVRVSARVCVCVPGGVCVWQARTCVVSRLMASGEGGGKELEIEFVQHVLACYKERHDLAVQFLHELMMQV